MTILTAEQRKLLDSSVQKARTVAEQGAGDALRALAVDDTHRPGFLTEDQNDLRLALRAKAQQLGDDIRMRGADLTLLVRDVAYEQWHRLLFARFLEQNGLLMHPDYPNTPLSLDDCEELAGEEGEPDGWALAARFASQILPGVFRLDDPAVQVPLAIEHRVALEKLLMAVPSEVFVAEDALGWVYQFWQTAEKKRVNAAGNKIGGADISPVTQLFTENYMVRFLLENSLGAWWAAHHPDSPLIAEWEYLRRLEDGTPAAGTFPEWPTTAAEVTVMDPCCGSGHFLVALFGMLWRMRAEEEGLPPVNAQDAVLRDNLFGLELDPRCTQIATFNVALEAWKQGGYREIPAPQIACSGVPVRQSLDEWLDGVPEHLQDTMTRLHEQFRNADTLGSLIDPRPAGADTDDGAMFGRDLSINVTWAELEPHLAAKFAAEGSAGAVLGHATQDVIQSARLLAGRYTYIATNPPYRNRGDLDTGLRTYIDTTFPDGKGDLATAFIDRILPMGLTVATVSPENWLTLGSYRTFRMRLLSEKAILLVARLGEHAFWSSSAAGAFVSLTLLSRVGNRGRITFADGSPARPLRDKDRSLRSGPLNTRRVADVAQGPDSRIVQTESSPHALLASAAQDSAGVQTGDSPRFIHKHWENRLPSPRWRSLQSTVDESIPYGGRSGIILWDNGSGELHKFVAEKLGEWGVGAWIRGTQFTEQRGVAISQMRSLPATLYDGDLFDNNTAVIVPRDPADLMAIWRFCSSPDFNQLVRQIDTKKNVTNSTLVKVPFDREHWQKVAEEAGPLPEPHSDDPTQWLFKGDIVTSTEPLQVAAARLLGYRWPDQEANDLDRFVDADGIVTLPDLGEGSAASRLRALLSAAYGERWSGALEHTLVTDAGNKTGRLEDWLRDTFFTHHCKIFSSRPFLWHVWDGRKDGFSGILHYHRLDRPTLEKLTYTSLGAWIRRQEHEVSAGTAGAEARLAAAQNLQRNLELIIEGEAPYDVYVRWKPMHEQPVGWSPDLDDGVRLNIRPFVTAGILRYNKKPQLNVHWKTDRGKNPDGSDRENDLHPTLTERRAARVQHEAGTP